MGIQVYVYHGPNFTEKRALQCSACFSGLNNYITDLPKQVVGDRGIDNFVVYQTSGPAPRGIGIPLNMIYRGTSPHQRNMYIRDGLDIIYNHLGAEKDLRGNGQPTPEHVLKKGELRFNLKYTNFQKMINLVSVIRSFFESGAIHNSYRMYKEYGFTPRAAILLSHVAVVTRGSAFSNQKNEFILKPVNLRNHTLTVGFNPPLSFLTYKLKSPTIWDHEGITESLHKPAWISYNRLRSFDTRQYPIYNKRNAYFEKTGPAMLRLSLNNTLEGLISMIKRGVEPEDHVYYFGE